MTNFNSEMGEVSATDILMTTGAEFILKYTFSFINDVIEVTDGPNGIVYDFPDGGCTVQIKDGENPNFNPSITLHSNETLTISDVDGIEEIPHDQFQDKIGEFEEALLFALRGDI